MCMFFLFLDRHLCLVMNQKIALHFAVAHWLPPMGKKSVMWVIKNEHVHFHFLINDWELDKSFGYIYNLLTDTNSSYDFAMKVLENVLFLFVTKHHHPPDTRWQMKLPLHWFYHSGTAWFLLFTFPPLILTLMPFQLLFLHCFKAPIAPNTH